ncbi:glycosyltransferase family 2 protein [Pectobacterium cacticida]|uniref:glycosyltransferase family 2 protein n=1 Tax=Pectobacterium cacticida TaxID=69221 RepID=UPI002FEEA646
MNTLSIIIPCYNCEHNIERLLSILLKQYRKGVEVILINDGSKDNTKSVIESFIKDNHLDNFMLYSFCNKGAAKARQLGLTKATGQYVFFCDSDDLLSTDFISIILYTINKNNPDMIYFTSVLMLSEYANGKKIDKMRFYHDTEFFNSDEFLRMQLENRQWTSAVWSYVFRRELVNISNAFFTLRKVHEDHIFTNRLLAHAKKINILRDTLYYQKRTLGSLTNSSKDLQYIIERYVAFEEAYNDMSKYFSKETMLLYKKWSIFSFLRLCYENKRIFFSGLLNKKFISIVWRDKFFFCRLIIGKIIKT